MKTIKTILFAVTLLLTSISAKAQYSITVENLSGEQGSKAELSISLTNGSIKVSGFQCDIVLPDGVTIEKNSRGKYIANLSDRKYDHVITVDQNDDSSYRFVSYSSANEYYEGESGVVATAPVILNAAPGEYVITVKNASFTNVETFEDVNCEETTATLTILPQEISLVHGEAYEGSETMEGVTVKYSRSFAHTEWQALYVPFNMAFDDWKNIGQVAELTVVTGTADAPVLEWTIVESGRISANTPYIFKPKAEGAVTFTSEGATLEAAAEISVAKTIGGATITLTGIYKTKTDMATDKAYGLSKGVFRPTTDNKHTLSPYLIYLKINAPTAQAPACVLNGVGGGGTTEIKIIGIETDQTEASYDLQGRVSSHGKGFEISNGKIVFNK